MILVGEQLESAAVQTLHPLIASVDSTSVDVHVSQGLLLEPKEFKTVPTSEAFDLATDLTCLLTGRSSHMRRGLYMPGGWVDPGMKGHVELEIFNMSDEQREIRKGEAAARLVFFELSEFVDAYDGKWSQ